MQNINHAPGKSAAGWQEKRWIVVLRCIRYRNICEKYMQLIGHCYITISLHWHSRLACHMVLYTVGYYHPTCDLWIAYTLTLSCDTRWPWEWLSRHPLGNLHATLKTVLRDTEDPASSRSSKVSVSCLTKCDLDLGKHRESGGNVAGAFQSLLPASCSAWGKSGAGR